MMFRVSIFLLVLFLYSCAPSGNIEKSRNQDAALQESFKLEVQQSPPRNIQSVQLYRKGYENNAPVIALNSSDKLVLEFDNLEQAARQFKIKITHRNKDWTQSTLSPNFYLNSFNEFYFGSGLKGFSQRLSFFHYSYEFPNNQISFEVSGNYLIEVYSYNSNQLLFSLPFFVSEDRGRLITSANRLFAQQSDFRLQHQLFSEYGYPQFVENPQFNLSFMYVQNQFWGRSRDVSIFDTATPGEVNFHLEREEAFIGNFEFNLLDLSTFQADGKQVLEIQQSTVPPTITLRRDVESLDPVPLLSPTSRFGLPLDNRSASYGDIHFQLETGQNIKEGSNIYLVGDFNHWIISEANKMVFNATENLWEGSAFIKQGIYAYKYVILKNEAIDVLTLDNGFSKSTQNYLTFVYYRDPQRNYHRLLKIMQTRSK